MPPHKVAKLLKSNMQQIEVVHIHYCWVGGRGGLGSSPGGGLLLANERRIVAVGFPSNCELHFIGKHAQPVFIQAPRIV